VTALAIPIFRRFASQSSVAVPRSVAGFTHLGWEPGERTGSRRMAYPYLMAVSTVVTLPIVIAFFFAQRTFIEGISLTGIKG